MIRNLRVPVDFLNHIIGIGGAPGGFGGRTPPLELKKQHNFVDIAQFVILCYIYF